MNSYKAPSVWSAARYFTIDIIPPGMPQLTTPETNKIFTTNNRPVLSWKAVPGANRYRVDISTNSTFTAMAVNGATVTTLSYTVPTALALPNGTYYWRIRAIDAAGNIGPAAPIRNFTVAMP
ncbi:MAG TPA: hypothetical protein VHO69_01030 [Phototrophicaceae bacterium]|nr:hypothetical protein [Phototrophicaceae bacterium]